MSDSMAICLSDVLNESCFPRTLGSDDEQPLDLWSYIPDITLLGAIKFVWMVVAAVGALGFLGYGLVTWFRKYQLQYFLRMNVCLFCAVNLLDLAFMDQKAVLTPLGTYSAVLWNYSVIASLTMIFVRYHWKLPINIVKPSHAVGFLHYKIEEVCVRERVRKKFVIIDLRAFPPVFPNGWIPIIESRAVGPGDVRGVNALGIRFCVFKSDVGELFVLNAYCPHLGADMSVGGRVRGNCIECPFHGWYANGTDGTCTRGPDNAETKKKPPVPSSVRVPKYHACETNGFIYVWHHAENEAPTWHMPRVEPICNGTWTYRGRTEHVVRCHIQEIPENGADINHLQQLHAASVFLGNDWMENKSWFNVVSHHWDPEWRTDEARPHVAKIKLRQTTTIFGKELPFSKLEIDIEQIGPATVHLHINSYHGRAILTQHIIPEEPLTMRVIHELYTEPAIKPFWSELLIRAEATMLERDIAVWNNKTFLRKSILLADDKAIIKYRSWYSKFYSEHSVKLPALNSAYREILSC